VRLFLILGLLSFAAPTSGEWIEDFEGAAPEGWERVDSDAHPPYNTVEIVRDPQAAKSGRQFLRMTTQGGATAFRRALRKAWAVDAGRPYRFSAWARLTATRRNSASIRLTWLNAAGEKIGELRSAPITQPGEWTQVSVEIPRSPAGAAGVSPRLDFEGDDVRGHCDFDLVTLAPIERLEIRPVGRAFPVFWPAESPRFSVTPAGVPDGTHAITITLRNGEGNEIRRSLTVTVPSKTSAAVDFPPLQPGAHELTASIDGSPTRRTLVVLVPSPWTAPGKVGEAPPCPSPIPLTELTVRELSAGPIVDSEGNPTESWLAKWTTQAIVDGAVPMDDPDFFPPAVRVATFRRHDGAALALWSEGNIELPLFFNEGARLCSAYGVLRPLQPGDKVRLGSQPVFVLGIDPLLLETRLEISSSRLPLQSGPATRSFRFHNPSPKLRLRDVRVRLEEAPPRWRVSPSSFSVESLAPGADLGGDLQFSIPGSETERGQDLPFEIRFSSEGREYLIHVHRPVVLVSPILMETAVLEGPQPDSRKITVRLTNGSGRPMTLALRSRLPNLPEQLELLRDLAPGGTSKTFSYVVKDVHLVDPARLAAEILAQESGGDRAFARKSLQIR
jgi:hypothetical protein